MNNKVLILILAVFAIGFFLLYKNFQEVKTVEYNDREIAEEVKISNDLDQEEMLDWNLYQNKNWGFELKHPNEFQPEVSIDFRGGDMFGMSIENEKTIFRMGIHDEGMESHIKLYIIENSEKEITVDGYSGLFFKKEDMSGFSDYIPHTIVKRGSVIYVFIGEGEVFDNILSTFRFI